MDGFLSDDAGVMRRVSRSRYIVGESGDEGGSSQGIDLRITAKGFRHGDEVDRFAFLVELADGLIDDAERGIVKIFGVDVGRDVDDPVRVHKEGADGDRKS